MSGRCRACNTILQEEEMRAKYKDSTEYIDLCFRCLGYSDDYEEDDLISINEAKKELGIYEDM